MTASGTKKIRVLIVDDSNDNLQVMSAVFDAAGADCVTTLDPAEAVRLGIESLASADPFRLIVVDIHMPGKNGQSVAKDLRDGGFKGGIVAFTAHPTMSGKRQGTISGIDKFLSKPTLKPDLVRALLAEYCK